MASNRKQIGKKKGKIEKIRVTNQENREEKNSIKNQETDLNQVFIRPDSIAILQYL